MKRYLSIPLILGFGWLQANDLEVDTIEARQKENIQLLEKMLTAQPAPQASTPAYTPSSQTAPTARLLDVSLILKAAAGASTATDDEIVLLQSGSHDPRRRGFTFQAGELSLSGAVDPYFKAEMHANFSESAVELEEAFITTTSLPGRLSLELGYFLTEFGRNNPRHSHEWDFVDQPLVVGRFFGGEGQRASGLRVSGILPLPWLSEWHIGMQSTTGELSPSFRTSSTTTIGDWPTITRDTKSIGDMMTLLRWVNAFPLSSQWETQMGMSAMTGPNSTGNDSKTTLLGADFVLHWSSPKQRQGYPFFRLEAETTQRTFEAASGVKNGLVYASEDLKDWAWLVQGVYGFAPHWIAGLRVEEAGGESSSFSQLRSQDPNRSDRFRLSPIITYKPSEFSKVSLQYNHDQADHLKDQSQSSVWLSMEVLIGSHPAHNF
jgi:hypothetical protein